MRVLFDNNVLAPLRRYLTGHEVTTARELGWHELENGDLLAAAEKSGFDVMVTADQNLSYQQNLSGRQLALVVLSTNKWKTIMEAPQLVIQAINLSLPGSFKAVIFEPRDRSIQP